MNRLTKLLLTSITLLVLSACGGGGSETPANIAPVASDASVSLLPGGTVTGTLVANDVDSNNLTISIVTGTSNGTLTLNDATTGAYTYTHDGNANGDSFTFWANDGLLDSNIATVTVTTVIPDVPASGLLATSGDQRVTLNWDAVEGADSYNVYWADVTGTGTTGTKITGVTLPFYHDGLTNGSDYFYVVTAVNAVGESAASIEVNATPVDILLSSLTFADANLQSCVQAQTATHVHDLTAIGCNFAGITQLSGIEALTGLTALYLTNNSISDVSPLAGLTNLTTLSLFINSIGGQGFGNVDALVTLTSAMFIALTGNIGMSCSELTTLISALGSPPVDIGAATDGVNCTNP